MSFLPQIDLSDEDMATLNAEATAAGYTVMEYVRVKLGLVKTAEAMKLAREARHKRDVIAPKFEDKAVTLEETKHGEQPTELARTKR